MAKAEKGAGRKRVKFMRSTKTRTIKRFDADLKQLAKNLDINFGSAVQKVVYDLFAAVNFLSPVRTGRFRASWGLSQDAIPDDPGAPPSASDEPNSVDILAEQKKRNFLDHQRAYALWYVFNNLPYAKPLEEGHSQQAAHGMLNLALAEVEADVDSTLDAILG